jgi:hypothetical protein
MFGSFISEDEESDFSMNETLSQTDSFGNRVPEELLVRQLGTFVRDSLIQNCPVLTGNLVSHIKFTSYSEHTANIKMSAMNYNTRKWKTYDVMRFYNDYASNRKGQYLRFDYANWLNIYGAFGRGRRDIGWVNNAVLSAVRSFAGAYNASIIIL